MSLVPDAWPAPVQAEVLGPDLGAQGDRATFFAEVIGGDPLPEAEAEAVELLAQGVFHGAAIEEAVRMQRERRAGRRG